MPTKASPTPTPKQPPKAAEPEKPAEEVAAKTGDERILEIQKELKCTLTEALALYQSEQGAADEPEPEPDPRKEVTVALLERHYEWLKKRAMDYSMARGEEVSIERALELIVREEYALDPDKAGTAYQAGSGPAGSFNKKTGSWD